MSDNLSVVIPSYNEEANIAKCLNYVHNTLQKLKIQNYEIILVNDGSRDKTGHIAKGFLKKIPGLIVVENKPNRGYGGALKAGFAIASKEFIVFVPSDNQFDFLEIERLIARQQETRADIVSGIRVNRQDPLPRKINAWLWNTLVRALFGYLASDIDCGFKLFRRGILEKVSLPSDGAMIDTQLFAGMRARGMKVEEVAVTHLPRIAGQSTGANLQVILKALKELVGFWWQLKQEIWTEQGRTVFQWEALVIIAILLISAFVRLYKIDQYMTFLGDEGRDALVVRDMLLGRKFTLIGPGTSIGNMYLGPWYYYMMLVPLALSNFHPAGPAIQVALLGVATVGLLWWIGRQWFGRMSALLMSLLYGLSPTIIIYTKSSWNPNIMPFFALLTMYGIWKVWRFGYWRWLVISTASFVFVLNSHYLGLLLFPVMVIFTTLAPKKSNWTWYMLFSVLVFLFMMSPLFMFDIRHGWINILAIKHFFTDRQTTVSVIPLKAIPQLWPIWQMIIKSLLKVQIMSLLIPILLIFIYRKKNWTRDLSFVIIWLGMGLVGLGLYKQHIYDHYFGFLYPEIFLLLGFIFDYLKKWQFVLGTVLLIAMLIDSPLRYAPNNQWKHTQEVVQIATKDANNAPFNFALIAAHNYDKSYRYALDIVNSNYKPIADITSQLYVVCEDQDCQPIGNPLWEIAAFGWAKIERQWEFPWGVQLFKLVRNIDGRPQ